ncbi:hypothetical protein HIM_08901 [Hirsutella minnesotensis 3608]|uniref:Uncharacterized protein n=1 Tax=Hirsutella minnesotensis 3608 TaxID=1043627 RepID=A0A0F8A3E8_9HYPO|nr:hypothetical protein HIM_08901 [Hirsutella minnesotensis 3608]
MAPKEPFKVHSLNKHIEDTRKGLSAEAQYNRRTASRPAAVVKQEPSADKVIFNNDSDAESESESSDDDSDEDSGAKFVKNLSKPNVANGSVASKRSSTSDEIADSDDERNSAAKKDTPPQAIKPEPESSDESASESDADKSKLNSVANKKSSSTSSETSSEDDSDDDDNGAKADAVSESGSESESDEGSESDSSSSSDEEEATPSKSQVTSKATTNDQSASSSEDESESEDDAESKVLPSASPSASAVEQSDHEMADESIHIEDRQHNDHLAVPNSISPDFVLRKGGSSSNAADVARICSQANLQGKQFWYFTVPSGVPISVIQNLEIPMDPAQRGDRAFSHGGEDYGVSFDNTAPKSSIQILIPSADGSQYQTAPRQIDQFLRVRRITQLGADSALVGPSERNAPRPQPKGLKARFEPIGVNGALGKIGTDSGSEGGDQEMTDAPPLPVASNKKQPEKPEKTTPKGKKGKRKEKGVATGETLEATVPRSAKRKQPSSEDDAVAASSQLINEVHAAQTSSKKAKRARDGSPDLGSEPPPSVTVTKVNQTPVAPPTLPNPTFSFSGLGSTPADVSTPLAGKSKKSKKLKGETPVPSGSQTLPVKSTPVPLPRQTAVPIPTIPSSAQQPKVSPVPIPQPVTASQSKDKKNKKRRESQGKSVANGSSQPAPPSSAQTPAKKKKKESPAQAPELKAPA